MKKSINIGIILLFLLQACSGEENTKNQTALEEIPEDTAINSPQVLENPVENEIIENEDQYQIWVSLFPGGNFLAKFSYKFLHRWSCTQTAQIALEYYSHTMGVWKSIY